MIQLNVYDITNGNCLDNMSENNIICNIKEMSFSEVESFLKSKCMKSKNVMFLKFQEYQFLDELFLLDKQRSEFENFVFNLIESRESRFVYFLFKIKSTDMEKLIHNGFYEWIDYWMLFIKFTHINFVFEIDDNGFEELLPLSYRIVKKIENPRLTLFLNLKNDLQNIPEDINVFTLMISSGAATAQNKYPYAEYCVE